MTPVAPFMRSVTSPPAGSTQDQVARLVAKSELHEEVLQLGERVEVWTRHYTEDLAKEKAAEKELEAARPRLESEGARIKKWQKVRRILPKAGMASTVIMLPCMSLGASLASPILLGVALVAGVGVVGSILGIEKLKSWLPDKIDTHNLQVDRFNRKSNELDGLREETRKSQATLDAAVDRWTAKMNEEMALIQETSKMADAVTGRRPEGAPVIEEADDGVMIGSIRLPRIQHEP